eukprot:TRINITY_DN3675_c0_g1_i1.p1 TRINITY_DN3675_c0_g1~~TRINITY_DN3675_c0_g1_i1.p1  ORF type:complete len:196 (-),score=49.25 TRINITY_DN3675_c0_g1_i1:88-603(-)
MSTTASSSYLATKESVWDYPRPPALVPCSAHLVVKYKGHTIADTTQSFRILETSHPPTFYLPPDSVNKEYLKKNSRSSYCEWKGAASYWDLVLPDGETVNSRIWSYENPDGTSGKYAALKSHLAFYASPFTCYVDGEEVKAQPGDFYGGWMTSNIDGGKKGVKGGPGTWGW